MPSSLCIRKVIEKIGFSLQRFSLPLCKEGITCSEKNQLVVASWSLASLLALLRVREKPGSEMLQGSGSKVADGILRVVARAKFPGREKIWNCLKSKGKLS